MSQIASSPPPPPPFLPPDEVIRKKLESQQVYIQAFLTATFIVYTIILILGRLRSRGNKFMKLCSTYSFMITAYLVSYIPGLMSAPGETNDLYVFWMSFVAYLAAVTNEISCYSLDDNEDRKKRLIVDYTVVWPLIVISLYKSLVAPEILVPIVIIFWVVVLKLRERSSALLYATRSSNGLCRATELISDFAKHHKEPRQMNNALVGLKEAQSRVAKQLKKGFREIDYDAIEFITLDKVLGSNEPFLVSTNEGKELLETCVSFAMFWTLLAKIAGFKNVNPHVFWGDNQLPGNCFTLVEKELDFLYEYFFTNSYAIYSRGIWKKLRDLSVITLFFWLTIPLLIEYHSQDHNILYILIKGGLVLDTGFTRFVIIAIIAIEYAQIGVFLTSKWAKIMYTCSYLQTQTQWGTIRSTKSNLLQRLIRIACKIPRPRLSFFCLRTFTTRKIGQYSILDCYGEIPGSVWCQCWIGSYIDLPRMGQAGNWDTVVTSDVRESIVDTINYCLRERKGISSGHLSLRKNEVSEDVIGTHVRNDATQARNILIWHIATCLFEDDAKNAPSDSYSHRDFHIATVISNYCAYLVAFLPQALADQGYTTQREFDEAIKEFKRKALVGDEEKSTAECDRENTILGQAEILKQKLEHSNKWRTLADFWTEMLLFIALTDTSEALDAHVNSLCVGGEFITHLWTLLTHTGLSKEL